MPLQKVILDCDPGNGIPGANIDDGLALAFLLRHPEVDLLGVTIVAGNTELVDGFAAASELVELAEAQIPVLAGACQALVEDPAPWQRYRHRFAPPEAPQHQVLDFWAEVAAPTPRALPPGNTVPDFLYEQVSSRPGEVTVVATGPLTNLAQTVQRHPDFARQVRQLVVMGGAFDQPNYPQETNFAQDPEAAEIVLAAGAPMVLLPLDVTLQTSLTPAELQTLNQPVTPLGRYLVETTTPWLRLVRVVRDLPGCPVHDVLAAATVVFPALLTTAPYCVAVETVGALTRGRPVRWQAGKVWQDTGLDLPQRDPITVATAVHNGQLRELLRATFTS